MEIRQTEKLMKEYFKNPELTKEALEAIGNYQAKVKDQDSAVLKLNIPPLKKVQ